MALDPNIILQARGIQLDSPLDTYARVAQVQAARNQNRIADMAFADKARATAADSSLAQLLAGGSTGADVVKGLAGQGYGSQALSYQKSNNESLKAEADLKKLESDAQKSQREAAKSSFDSIAATLGALQGVQGGANPVMVQRALGHLSDIGVIKPEMVEKVLASVPQDPSQLGAWLQQQQNAAISAKDQLTNSLTQQRDAEVRRANGVREANAAGMLGVARGNLGVAQQRLSLEKQRIPAGYRQNPDGSLSFIPGGPADPSSKDAKMTEDQSKATGWLIQAENSFDNLRKVAFDEKGNLTEATKPGIGDAIASIPLLGGVGNSLRSPARQKFNQAASAGSEALLRAATGAGVNKEEAKQKVEELTPVWGESPETTKQKFEAIPLYIESLRVRSGAGAKKADVALSTRTQTGNPFTTEPAAKQVAAAKPAPAMKNSDGWVLHTDAKGNRAYVSPDGKSFKEVK